MPWKRNHFRRGNIEYLVPSAHATHNFLAGEGSDLLPQIFPLTSSWINKIIGALLLLCSCRAYWIINVYCISICVGRVRAGQSEIESRWGRDFPPVQPGPVAHPASCKMGIGSFLGVKCGRGVLVTTHPLLVPRSWKSRAIPLPTLWATPDL